LLVGLAAVPALAQVPPPGPVASHFFYGSVNIGGSPAYDGTVISAHIGDLSWATTTKDGKYGYYPLLLEIPGDDPGITGKDGGEDGDEIIFKVGGIEVVRDTFAASQNTILNLSLAEAYTLMVDIDPGNGGDVNANGYVPSSYPYPCIFDGGTNVTVEAIPADDCWYFTGWSGDLSGSTNPTTIYMDDDKSITASFAKYEYTLTVAADPTAGGTVTGGGTYDCCSTVNVTAIPADGWYFVEWSGDLIGTESPTNIHIDGAKNVTANFEEFVVAQITGVTGEVNCDSLDGVNVQLFDADGVTPIGSPATSDGSGNYVLPVPAAGIYDVVASKAGFRNETQTNVVVEVGVNILDFRGDTGLVPNEPDASYAMDCVHNWLFPPSTECGLSAEKAMDVIHAWLFPIIIR